MEVIFSSKSFRDMILFSGRFANSSIPERDWKEVYGFLVGKVIEREGKKFLYVAKLIPMVHGTRMEIYFNEQDYGISKRIINEIYKALMFVCGYYHTRPGFKHELFLSETDLYNQFGFQSTFEDSIATVFDLKQISDKNTGLKVFRLDNFTEGVASNVVEVPYQIESNQNYDKYSFARSFINIAENYEKEQPLIKEAGEILKQTGSLENIVGDLTSFNKVNAEEYFVSKKSKEIPISEFSSNNNDIIEDSGFYELLEQYSEGDWEIRSIRERIEKNKENGEATGHLMINLANFLIKKSLSINEALAYLESAEAEFSASNDNNGLAIVKNELGLFYEERGDYHTSLNYFEDSLHILENLKDYVKIIQVQNNIGNIYLKINKVDVAFSHYKEAYDNSRKIDFTMGMVSSLNNSVDVLLFLHNYRLAHTILVNNYKYFEKINNLYGLGITLSKFGHLYFSQGQKYYHISESYYRNALDIKMKNKYMTETLEDWIYLSKIFSSRNELDSAESSLLQGLDIVRTFDLEKEEGQFYDLLGDLYIVLNKTDEADEYYNLAIRNYQDFGDEENLGEIHEKFADINLTLLNNLEKSLSSLYVALEIYRRNNYSKKIADNLVKIADIQIDLHDESSAIECLFEARSIYQNLFDQYSTELITEKLRSLGRE